MRRTAPAFLLTLCGFWLGWRAHSGHQAEIERAIQQNTEKTRQHMENIARQSARQLENKLETLRANEVHTETVIQKEVVKPVFSHVCATDEYVRLFNQATTETERALSGKFENALPGKPAAP
ncbi:hypothetical protein C5471_05465 [Photorhabdus tasmaniensis]|uniref:DUF2570 domain-containing protein n=1 Tax=Photorhabdus tasmaniensis TaxID=1004159 RepID=A0ABX0GGY7_9GAMM|nr:hypothetical protein [Photorhabdus tasmaniensis]